MIPDGVEHRTLRRNLRDLPTPAWILVAGAFVNRFASFAVVFLVLYLTKRGVDVTRSGLAVAAYGVGEMAASWAGGHLADRIGRRNTIALSMFASAAAMLTLARVESYPSIVAAALGAGLAAELYRPAGAALMADLVPEGQRVTAFAVLRFAVNLAFAAGVAVAGFLADRSFLWVFVSDAATSIAFGVAALLALPQGMRAGREDRDSAGASHSMFQNRTFVAFLGASALVTFVYFQQQTTLPLHVTGAAGLSYGDFGLLLSLNGLLIVLLELPLSSVTMRRDPRVVIALSFLLIGSGFALTAVAHSFPALAGAVAVWTLGEMIGAPVSYAYVADIAPAAMRGRYQGVYGVVWASGTVTGPALGAVLFGAWGGWFWALCGALGALASVFLATAGRPARARGAAALRSALPWGPGAKA